MKDFRSLVVLSVLAAVLVAGVITTAAVNSYALLGLAPVLLAIAAIVRAVAGRRADPNPRASSTIAEPTSEGSPGSSDLN